MNGADFPHRETLHAGYEPGKRNVFPGGPSVEQHVRAGIPTRLATKDQGSSGQSYVLDIVPQLLDAGPEWEDNTGWSGTSKQVRSRKPFEP
jgi:hypothetical protein